MTQTNNQAAFGGFELGAELSSEQIEAKAHELLAQLTLDEKIEIMDGDVSFWSGLADMMGGGYGDHPWNAGVIWSTGATNPRSLWEERNGWKTNRQEDSHDRGQQVRGR